MAEKKSTSKAQKKVSDTKTKTSTKGTTSKSTGKAATSKKAKTPKKPPQVRTEYDNPISASYVVAFLSLCLFILFVIISVNPEGALLKVVKSVVFGLVGPAGFYFAIPALLYLFILHVFCRRTPVLSRSLCTVCFAFSCGVLFHLAVAHPLTSHGFQVLPELYRGGVAGTSGGVVCGGFAHLLLWACGKPLSILIVVLTASLTLLGAMQITIPSIIRAIANRPRDDWEEEEGDDDYIEPAAIVVNHIANRQIEHRRQRRAQMNQPVNAVPELPVQDRKSVV